MLSIITSYNHNLDMSPIMYIKRHLSSVTTAAIRLVSIAVTTGGGAKV